MPSKYFRIATEGATTDGRGSPVSDDGRGLKHSTGRTVTMRSTDGSPVSDDGRGLKQALAQRLPVRRGRLARQR